MTELEFLCGRCGDKTTPLSIDRVLFHNTGTRVCNDTAKCNQRRHLGIRLVDLTAELIAFGPNPKIVSAVQLLKREIGL